MSPTSVEEWLVERFRGTTVTPDTSLLDLGIDSLDWLELTAEIERRFGVRLTGDAVSRIKNVANLLREVAEHPPNERTCPDIPSPLEQPEAFLGKERLYWLKPLGAAELAAAWCVYVLNRSLVRSVFRLTIQGREKLPAEGFFVLAPHHVSYLDSLVLGAALDFALLRKTYWAAWTGVAFGPAFRLLRRLTHVVPVDSARGAASSLAYGAAVLRSQHNLIWFPEGKLSLTGGLLELQPGIGLLLTHYPVPVVPVYIEGTREALPPGHRCPRSGRISITFESPLDPRELATNGSGAERSERITSALHDEMARLCRAE